MVVETTMRPAFEQEVHDLAEAAHQLGLRGVDPQVVVDAEQHVLAVEHVDVAARRRTAPSRARARSVCLPAPALPTNMTSAARWPWRCARSAAVTPPWTQLKSRVRASARRSRRSSDDGRGDDAAAGDVVAVDDDEAPGRLAVGRQVEGDRLPQLEHRRRRRRGGRRGPSSSALSASAGVDDLVDLVDAHRQRRRAELELVVAPGDERLLAQPDHVRAQARADQRRAGRRGSSPRRA